MDTTPQGYTTVAPRVVTDDTGRLLDFVGEAFEVVELAWVAVEDGTIGHSEIRVGDTVVLAFDRRGRSGRCCRPCSVSFTPDAGAAMARAVAAGGIVVTELADSAFG